MRCKVCVDQIGLDANGNPDSDPEVLGLCLKAVGFQVFEDGEIVPVCLDCSWDVFKGDPIAFEKRMDEYVLQEVMER